MLTSATTVIERRTKATGVFGTHPYEAGWAAEALFFVRVEGIHPQLRVQPQVSPDGVDWIDWGTATMLGSEDQLIALEMRGFGTWVRLLFTGASPQDPAILLINLALKG